MNKKNIAKKSTMADVAKKAGVTKGTVSHVINDTAPISEKTKNKVFKAIKELNYTPNAMARGLRRSESKMIGLLVPDITNEYYSQIARSFIDMAYEDGYTVMLCSFQYDLERERIELDVLVNKSVDAIVIIGGSNDDKALLSNVKKMGIPIILGDRSYENGKNIFPSVEFDNRSMVKDVINYLTKKNYTRIGFVTETLTMTNLKDRYDGYMEGMREHHLEIKKDYIFVEKNLQLNKTTAGYDLMKQLLATKTIEELPEVFITTSDLVAIGMIGAIKDEGYSVPDDFGVVGYDNLSISAFLEPALTTIAQDANQIGSAAWDIVTQLLTKKNVYMPHLLLQQEFVIRKSI